MRIPGFLTPARRARNGLPRFLALTDPRRMPDPYVMLSKVPRDCGLVWRAYDKQVSRTQWKDMTRAANRSGVTLFLATSGKQGIPLLAHRHLPEHRLNKPYTDRIYRHRRGGGTRSFITAAAHSERAVIAAAHAGVDAVLISPVFPTRSHPGAASLGPVRFAALAHLARSLGLHVYALGGINDIAKIRRLASTDITGVAGIDIFLANDQA